MRRDSFLLFFVAYLVAIVYLAATTPLSSHEAKLFFRFDLLQHLESWLSPYLGIFLPVRLPSILFGTLGSYLFYRVAHLYLCESKDAYLATALFLLFPGVLVPWSLCNLSIIILTWVLLAIWLIERQIYGWLTLVHLLIFVTHPSSILYFSITFFYALSYRNKPLLMLTVPFLVAAPFFEKIIPVGGKPVGHFVETFGLYAGFFSPLLFLYFIYVGYRILLREEKRFIWYLSFGTFLISMILSLRQKIYITDFGHYVALGVIVMVWQFYKSYRIRLPRYRKVHRLSFVLVFAVLLLSDAVILTHRMSYRLSGNASKHFAHRIYEVYDRVKVLRKVSHPCVRTQSSSEVQLYRFYGIPPCSKAE